MAHELKQAEITILTDRKNPDGSTTYEWRKVEGYGMDLAGVTLRNGETITLDYTVIGVIMSGQVEFTRFENLHPHEQRVVVEHRDLSEKIDKLAQFMTTKTFEFMPAPDKELLKEQGYHMRAYQDVLERRIRRFI